MNNNQRSNSLSSAFDFDERQYKPVLKPVSPSCSGDSYSHTSDESITKSQRQVTLTKGTDDGYGFNIIGGTMGEPVFVSFILAGGAADKSKKLFKADQILKVNGQDISRLNHGTVVQILKASENKVNLLVISKPEEFRNCENHLQEFDDIMQSSRIQKTSSYNTIGSLRTTSKKTLYVRTLFSYDANKDCGLPNKGLSFKFGEILHVTNASDPEWWQARKVNLKSGEDETDLGIIPSKKRVERKNKSKARKVRICCNSENLVNGSGSDEILNENNATVMTALTDMKLNNASSNFQLKTEMGKQMDNKKQANGGLFTIFKTKSKSRSQIGNNNNNDQEFKKKNATLLSRSFSEIFYQPVIQEENSLHRPVIIIGACKESLNSALLREHSDSFAICIPHTTRPPASNDMDEMDFFFITPSEMNELLNNHQLIETGRSGDYLYGTSLQAVLDVAESGRHCVLDVSSAAVRRLWLSGLPPITLLVSASSVVELVALGFPANATTISSGSPITSTTATGTLDTTTGSVRASVGNGDDNNDSPANNAASAAATRLLNKIDRLKHEYLPYITEIITGSNFEDVYQNVLHAISINNGRKIWLPFAFEL